MLVADLLNGTSGTGGTYYAGKKYDIMIDVANDGTIEGGQDVSIDGTIYVNGDPEEGYVCIASGGAVTWVTSIPA